MMGYLFGLILEIVFYLVGISVLAGLGMYFEHLAFPNQLITFEQAVGFILMFGVLRLAVAFLDSIFTQTKEAE